MIEYVSCSGSGIIKSSIIRPTITKEKEKKETGELAKS